MLVPVAINQVHCWADNVVVVKQMHDRNAKPACDGHQVQTVPGEVTDVNEVDRMAHQQRPHDRLVLGTDMRGEVDGCAQQVAIHSFVPARAKAQQLDFATVAAQCQAIVFPLQTANKICIALRNSSESSLNHENYPCLWGLLSTPPFKKPS